MPIIIEANPRPNGSVTIDGGVSGGGGSTNWGGIGGTLSAQTDLASALAGKQPLASVLTSTTAAFTTAQESKLAGIATGATANATDAALRDRSTHTGTQAAETITGLATVATSGAYSDLLGAPSLFDGAYSSLTGIPSTFAPSAHTHSQSDITGLPDALTAIDDRLDAVEAAGGGGGSEWTYVKLTSDEVSTSTTSADTALAFTPDANSQYEIEGKFYLQSEITSIAVRAGLDWPSEGIAEASAIMSVPTSTTALAFKFWGAPTPGFVSPAFSPFANESFLGTLSAMFNTGGTVTGDFVVTLQSELNGSQVKINAGSFIRYRKVP